MPGSRLRVKIIAERDEDLQELLQAQEYLLHSKTVSHPIDHHVCH